MNFTNAKLADFDINELRGWLAGAFNKPAVPAGLRTDTAPSERRPAPVPDYRADQIFEWIGRGARTFEEMTNLPSELRRDLSTFAVTGVPEIMASYESARDGTVKYAMRMSDGCVVESVLMRYRHGDAVCVSSQAGCRMGCGFCATKPGSFARDLSPGEMLGQVTSISKNGPRIGNVVVMGVGEPFDNYENTLKFIKLLHAHGETNIGYRKVTISTCGIVPGILRLAEEGLPVGLSVSLHAPNDIIRGGIMPVNKRYSIDKLIEGCKIYTYKTNRRVTFEYALIKDVNDAPDDARELLRKIRGMLCHINLIPVNKTEGTVYTPPSGERIKKFSDIIASGGLNVTVRRELGSDIMAACGQLRNSSGNGRIIFEGHASQNDEVCR